jgi:glycosyltransferase involved in cell wall biosynthesis
MHGEEPLPASLIPGDAREKVVLFFGSISHYKGLDVLVRAFARLPKERLIRTRLRICGNPQIPLGPIKTLVRESGIEDRVTWDLRYVPDEEIHSIVDEASLVALPYRHVDGSGVLSTVLSYGKPIVATRIGGFGEILSDGIHGRIVEPEDPDALSIALEDVLSDPTRSHAMGEAVKLLAERWPTWEEAAQETIRIYEKLCAAKS